MLTRPLDLAILGTRQDRESFYFFQHKTVPHINGFFKNAFWERFMLLIPHYEPSVRHAVIALGSLHQSLISGGFSSVQTNTFAFKHCNEAIRCVARQLPQNIGPSIDVCLTTCILFAIFEVISYPKLFYNIFDDKEIVNSM
jgi:hypothetical protein